MSWEVILDGLLLFLVVLSIHIIWWRAHRPMNHIGALIALFLFSGALAAAILPRAVEPAAVIILYVALSSAYIQTYPAAQALSPTLRVLISIGKAPEGLTSAEILADLVEETLVGARIEDLLKSGWIRPGSAVGSLRLTWQGKLIVPPFLFVRRLFGLPVGEG